MSTRRSCSRIRKVLEDRIIVRQSQPRNLCRCARREGTIARSIPQGILLLKEGGVAIDIVPREIGVDFPGIEEKGVIL